MKSEYSVKCVGKQAGQGALEHEPTTMVYASYRDLNTSIVIAK